MKLSISIVSYNTKEHLRACLDSIQKNLKDIEQEIVIVDNDSKDGSIRMIKEEFPEIRLIENKENLFFACANNQAIRVSKGKYILLLNSDTLLFDNSIKDMILFMEQNPDVGAIGGKMLYKDGGDQGNGWKFRVPLESIFSQDPVWRLFGKGFRIKRKESIVPKEMDVVSDAFMMVSRQAIFEAELYDERFKLYYTEDDICHKLKRKGWKCYYFPSACVVHKLFGSSKGASKLAWIKLTDKLKYYRKYHGLWITMGIGFFSLIDFVMHLLKGLKECRE